MRIGPIGLLVFASAGCLSVQPSLLPLFTPGESLAMPGIVGTWVEDGDDPNGDDPLVLTFRPLGNDGYEMTLTEGSRVTRGTFAVRFGRLQDDRYWDLTALPLDHEEGLWTEHRLPLHSFARLRWEEDRLEVRLVEAGRVKDAIQEGRLEVPHLELATDHDLMLTASTAELQRFLVEHAEQDDLLGDPIVFHRGTAD
jgi:hypothetical protein